MNLAGHFVADNRLNLHSIIKVIKLKLKRILNTCIFPFFPSKMNQTGLPYLPEWVVSMNEPSRAFQFVADSRLKLHLIIKAINLKFVSLTKKNLTHTCSHLIIKVIKLKLVSWTKNLTHSFPHFFPSKMNQIGLPYFPISILVRRVFRNSPQSSRP